MRVSLIIKCFFVGLISFFSWSVDIQESAGIQFIAWQFFPAFTTVTVQDMLCIKKRLPGSHVYYVLLPWFAQVRS